MDFNKKELTKMDCQVLIRIIMDSKTWTPKKGELLEKLYNIMQRTIK